MSTLSSGFSWVLKIAHIHSRPFQLPLSFDSCWDLTGTFPGFHIFLLSAINDLGVQEVVVVVAATPHSRQTAPGKQPRRRAQAVGVWTVQSLWLCEATLCLQSCRQVPVATASHRCSLLCDVLPDVAPCGMLNPRGRSLPLPTCARFPPSPHP